MSSECAVATMSRFFYCKGIIFDQALEISMIHGDSMITIEA